MLFGKRQPISYLVVGLGNPGLTYENTRHNAGFVAIDALAKDCGAEWGKVQFKAKTAEAEISGTRCLLLKPNTFMNLSGEAVALALDYYNIPPERMLVFSDEIALDVGRLRVRRSGSAGGHNGLKSIIHETGCDQFPRIRLGVGKKPHPDYDLAKWVLSHFNDEEQKILSETAEKAAEAAKLVIAGEVDEAMNRYNG